ncbi:hypothetical protein D6C77_01549 [Aureobasidium pullulans]|uniref:BTB domain-containing protein n=1 Tax=Aureobasidium pullulans TaxID=5580 RepID=A0A4T0BBR4_AURPU|nr:hypothetical protein D6D21_01304 [Aureobasidium pullulans]THW89274.1 hypothetical protein D6D15_05373 [Aureobasidium pullulans]THX25832.1 hypothetical protein D6D12_06630 [Aureobasidium pullulans]THX47003.1 hypothetical protein D6D08_10220 [Aureobasidium pullulans]TIA31561.1 hypothetical protein D6C79_09399 [Aureobasidium pullulans]
MSTAAPPNDDLMPSFFNNNMFSDVILRFGKYEINAHKVILAQQSKWFLSKFREDPTYIGVYKLDNTSHPDTLLHVLRYMYHSGWVHDCLLKPEVVYPLGRLLNLYDVADRYNIGALKHKVNLCFWYSSINDLDRLAEVPTYDSQFIRHIHKICGADSEPFDDDTLQKTVVHLCAKYHKTLLKIDELSNSYNQDLLFNAKCAAMFAEEYAVVSLAGDGWGRERNPDLHTKDLLARERNTTEFFDNPEFADITLTIGKDREFNAHKVVLAGHSTSFLAHFDAGHSAHRMSFDNNDDDPAIVLALIRRMYMPLPPDIPLPSYADLCLLARSFGCHAVASGLEIQFMDLLVREPINARYISSVSKVCGPEAGEHKNTALSEQIFQDVLERITDGESYCESFARAVKAGLVFNPKFAVRLAGQMLVIHRPRRQ